MIDYMLDICMYYFFHVSMQLLQSLPSNSTATNLDQAIVTFKLTVFLMLFLLNRVYMCPCRLSSNIELFFLSNLILAYYIFIIILIMLSHRCPQFFKETKIFLPSGFCTSLSCWLEGPGFHFSFFFQFQTKLYPFKK